MRSYLFDGFAKFGLPCSLRSHHKPNPTQKMATPLFGFAHPPPYSEKLHKLTKKKIEY